MRFRVLALSAAAIGLLAVGAAPGQAATTKKFEGTIAIPSTQLGNETANGEGASPLVCPDAGEGEGVWYKFFDLKSDFQHFKVTGTMTLVDEPDPTGDPVELTRGTINEYDLDLWAFDAKCKPQAVDGSINGIAGKGLGTSERPARFIAVTYYAGPYPNIAIEVEASTEKFKS